MSSQKPRKLNTPEHLKETGIPITHVYNTPAVGWIQLTDYGNHEMIPGYPERYVITPVVQYDPKAKQWILIEYQLKHVSQILPAEEWIKRLNKAEHRDHPTLAEA